MEKRALVLADLWAPRSLAADALLVVAGAAVTALLARLEIRLPHTPVPITGQTLGVLLAGGLLGSRRGAAAMLAYLGAGLAGAPVFASGGAGPFWLAGPTGGFLLGFLPAAWVAGRLCEEGWDRRPLGAALAMAAGLAALYAMGVAWLAGLYSLGSPAALAAGLWPFLPGEAVKIALAAALLPAGWRLLGRR